MIEIKKYEDKYQDEVIRLVLSCQNDGTRPIVSIADQPELLNLEPGIFHKRRLFLDCIREQ